MVIYFHLLLFS
jgi:hypothetical protein